MMGSDPSGNDRQEAPEAAAPDSSLAGPLRSLLLELVGERRQPSAWELLRIAEERLGLKVRWEVEDVLHGLARDKSVPGMARAYFQTLLDAEDWEAAVAGAEAPSNELLSTIDTLIRRSSLYRSSRAFQVVITFMARFREYAPYNNMLVWLQNPCCGFYATERDWAERFGRGLKDDARPMLILAPMHPVLLVYDVDQTEGAPLPAELERFATFAGEWNPDSLRWTIENAAAVDRILIGFKPLSSTLAGFATLARGSREWKMRIAIHDQLDEPSRYGVLCHELAHIYLGHLRGDSDGWWPSRMMLGRGSKEIEAEAVAFVVTSRMGLHGSSEEYVSRHLKSATLPPGVSPDQIAKVAGRIERMGSHKLSPRMARPSRETPDLFE